MKTPDQIKPNYGPVYAAAMYPDLAAIFQRHGYALAVHGSLARDFDLIAVAWASEVSRPTVVLDAVMEQFAVTLSADSPVVRNHGRAAYTLICGFGDCQMDISFLPRFNEPAGWKCDLGNGEWDHDWRIERETSGECDGGRGDEWTSRVCKVCGINESDFLTK